MITRQTVRLGALFSVVLLGGCKGFPDMAKPGPKKVSADGLPRCRDGGELRSG